MEFIITRMSPDALSRVQNSNYYFSSMKEAKKNNVCRSSMCDKHRMCGGCERLKAVLCRKYHGIAPTEELAARLAFEVLFDIVPVKAVENGTWMDARYRDNGHTGRVHHLWRTCKGTATSYKWITAPRR